MTRGTWTGLAALAGAALLGAAFVQQQGAASAHESKAAPKPENIVAAASGCALPLEGCV